MKTKLIIGLFILLLYNGTTAAFQNASAQGASVSFQIFYDELSPYGTWVISPDYGYVWVPDVDPGFSPYATNGYWIFTDMGWTWVSNYSWGWAPFHYGRWYNDPYYGAMWVPDNEWGPGWVTWRRSANYYGWAPIGPGVSLSLAYSNGYNLPSSRWTFVSGGFFGRTNISNYYIRSSSNVTIINNSTVINNTRVDQTRNVTYNEGPSRTEVEKRIGKSITPVAIKEINKPGQSVTNNQLQVYRPKVQKNVSSGPKPAPAKAVSYKNTSAPAQKQTAQPARQQPVQQQKAQPTKQQPVQQQKTQPAKQQPVQQQKTQPAKQQPVQQQPNAQPAKQQPVQQQPNAQPAKKQPSPTQKKEPVKDVKEVKDPHQNKETEKNKPPK